ncbi:MAG: glycosyltransferase family 4 protein [Candidatus Saccharibacteria bacterium]|nr:glycosyltransferase family 4 protein [Candidatus Saccharibacteria bacterium]
MLGWELPPHNSGGLGVACYHMSKALSQEGASIDFVLPYDAEHDIDFLTIHPATELTPLHRNGMGAYYRCSCDEQCDHVGLNDLRGVQQQYGQYVEQLVKKVKPQVIHAHDWLTMEAGMLAKKATGAPLIVHVHATEYDRSGEFHGNPLVHDIEQEGLLMADRIIAVSQITKNLIVDRYGIPAEKIEVVHNTIDPEALGAYIYDQNTYAYLDSLKKEGYKVVTNIGRLTIQKGLKYFMYGAAKASEKYDKLLFLIAGDGEQRDELIELACDLGISDKVFFTGFIRGQAWRDAYSVGDIFVMNSVSEPFGLTALEAAAHDSALLISRQAGVGEVLNNVMRFDYWDVNKFADELVGIATSDSLRNELANNVAGEYSRISWRDVAKRIKEIYYAEGSVA